jgi:hypothetical protein
MPDRLNPEEESRLDRVERMLSRLTDGGRVDRRDHAFPARTQDAAHGAGGSDGAHGQAGQRVDKLAERMEELAAAQRHTDERLNALIGVVDGIVPKPPSGPAGPS